MTEMILCDIHGAREATVVCEHIVDTLIDGTPRGFRWLVDENGEYEATCDSCSALSDAEWEEIAVETGRVLCFECYARAASLNGIEFERPH